MTDRTRFLVWAVGGSVVLIALIVFISESWLTERLVTSAGYFSTIVVQVGRDPGQSLDDPAVQRSLEQLATEQAAIAARGLHRSMMTLGVLAAAIAAMGSMLLAGRFVGDGRAGVADAERGVGTAGADPAAPPDAADPPDDPGA